MAKKATRQQVLNALAYHLDWARQYMDAARRGDKQLMEKLDREWNVEAVIKSKGGQS